MWICRGGLRKGHIAQVLNKPRSVYARQHLLCHECLRNAWIFTQDVGRSLDVLYWKRLSQLSLAEAGPVLRSVFHASPEVLTSLATAGPANGPDEKARARALAPLCACLLVSCREAIQRAARQHGFDAALDLQLMATTAHPFEVLKFLRVDPGTVFMSLDKARAKETLQATLKQFGLCFNDLLVLLFHLEADPEKSKTLLDKVSFCAVLFIAGVDCMSFAVVMGFALKRQASSERPIRQSRQSMRNR